MSKWIDSIRDGDIILFHTKGFSPISVGIRMLTESFWNHVGMYVSDINKEGFVIEALGRGVVKTPIEKYINNKSYILKAITLRPEAFKDEEEYREGLKLAISKMRLSVGQKYDWWAIVYLGILYISKGFWHKSAKKLPTRFNPLQSRNRFFCSELICESCYKISSLYDYLFQGKTKQKCDTTTPKDIGKAETVKFIGGYDAY